MDYLSLKDTAINLITEFGKECVLKKQGESFYNPETMENETLYTEVAGVAVRLGYETEAVGASNGLIQAGDLRFICSFEECPVETEDFILFQGIEYTVINVADVSPDGETVLIYKVQARKV